MKVRLAIFSVLFWGTGVCFAQVDIAKDYETFCSRVRDNETLGSYALLLNDASQYGIPFLRATDPTRLDTKDHLIAQVVAKRFSSMLSEKDWQTKNRVSAILLSWVSTCAYDLRDSPLFITFNPTGSKELLMDLSQQRTAYDKRRAAAGVADQNGIIHSPASTNNRFFAEHPERKPLSLDEPLIDSTSINYPIFLVLLFPDGQKILANTTGSTLESIKSQIDLKQDSDANARRIKEQSEAEVKQKAEFDAAEKAKREAYQSAIDAERSARQAAIDSYRNRDGISGTVINLLSLFVILFTAAFVLRRPYNRLIRSESNN